MGIKWVTRMCLLVSLLVSTTAWSAEIHGNSSTQFLWYNNQVLNNQLNSLNGQRQFDVAQYLRLGITNIDKAGKFSIYGYGRISQDFDNGTGGAGRLYYLYGEYRDLFDKADIRVGRQFVNVAAGSAVIDGLQLDIKNIGPVGFSLFGGRDVVFGLSGELGYSWNTDLGMSVYLTGFKQTDAEVSWFRKWDHGNVARDILGVSGKQYLLNNLKVYGNAKFDLTAETFNEVQAGLKYYPTSNLVFTGEYFQSYATFDTTSIYSVFAVNQYEEGVFRVDYTFNDMVTVNAGYNRQGYGEGAAANVYHVGLGVRPIEALRVNVEYDNRTGYYGNTNGVIIDADYAITKKANIAGGFTYDVYQRDVMLNDDIARRYWLGGKYKLTDSLAVSGRVQTDVNAQYSHNTSGRVVFDYNF